MQLAPAVPLAASQEDLKWFRDAKFGLFITWGPVTLKGHGAQLVARREASGFRDPWRPGGNDPD